MQRLRFQSLARCEATKGRASSSAAPWVHARVAVSILLCLVFILTVVAVMHHPHVHLAAAEVPVEDNIILRSDIDINAAAEEGAPSSTAPARRVVVIGDLHGDFDQALAILQLSGVVRRQPTNATANDGTTPPPPQPSPETVLETLEWIGDPNTDVVQMGDLLDRGPQDKEVMDLFMALRTKAEAAGGSVTVLLGNHELMNLVGDFRYVNPEGHAAFGGIHRRREMLSREGVYGAFLRSLPLVHVIDKTLFVHAGLSEKYAQYGIQTLNQVTRNALLSDDFDNPVFASGGPLWTRLLINRAEHHRCDMVEDALDVLGMHRMIVGHTPQRDLRIGSFCNGRLVAVDVGISKHMYGGLAALEITADPVTGEAVLAEISASNVAERADEELDKTEKSGGYDLNILQEMMDTVNEQLKGPKTEGGRKRKRDAEGVKDHHREQKHEEL